MDKKEQIILATLELAAENGLGSVSMSQIAEKLGTEVKILGPSGRDFIFGILDMVV